MNSKTEIRAKIKKIRQKLSLVEKKDLDKAIIEKIKSNSLVNKAGTILAYMSHKNEVDLIDFINENISKKHIILPRVNKNTLDLYIIETLDDLEEGTYGIMEPKTTCKTIKPEDIDLAFIPGVAFDANGHRIGYGKGYYDQLNKSLKCKKIGLAYNFQIVDEIPFESHDVPVDFIISN